MIWLDNRHRVLAFEELFRGTIDGASVHPREVVRAAIRHNAAACIFAHNHPSGVAEPSQSDRRVTQRLKDALTLVKVRTPDHVIAGETACSFAERGLLYRLTSRDPIAPSRPGQSQNSEKNVR